MPISEAFTFREDKRPTRPRAFLDFVRSGEGGKTLRANGCVPVQ